MVKVWIQMHDAFRPLLGRIRWWRHRWRGEEGGAEEREASVAERMEGGAAGVEASWGGSDDGDVDGVGRRVGVEEREACVAEMISDVRRGEDLEGDGGRTMHHRMWTPTLLS
jgi:hypothetical protein